MQQLNTPYDWTHEQVVKFADNREAVDESLSLLGLILFRNELKDHTADAIAKLKAGDIRTVMITGDNAMCGCYIARQRGMASSSSREEYDLPAVKHLVEQGEDVELAVTGVAFDYLVAMGEIKGLLLNIRIFSRMTPDGKVECVKLHMETGAVTGMGGDGSNDCGALHFAHAGVALSDAEASVVSPFTSKSKTIQSVVDLCREGRCSVATSFASVKFVIVYGLIGSVMRAFQSYHTVIVSQWCWILSDGVSMLGCAYVMKLSKPLKELKAVRPTSSLIGPTTLVSMLGQQIVNVIFLCCSVHLLTSEVWYCPFSPVSIDVTKWWLMADIHLSMLF
ncbi:P-type ATPase (P-ATPase) Superfamily [Phytophthora palmivora]|uniref:P-type ATPase (P-ATPase) Superfamily n=1 Tax=Phytophthora palmivora TaxID=4796 RepID=A0A2P4XBU0_9STRA|nr:P-type ATPase (P-ATPase) Superfamily [Phytophthora palmivora]